MQHSQIIFDANINARLGSCYTTDGQQETAFILYNRCDHRYTIYSFADRDWKLVQATNANQARIAFNECATTKYKKIYPVLPYGERGVDQWITPNCNGWVVHLPANRTKMFNSIDSARAYTYVVYVEGIGKHVPYVTKR